MSRNSAPEAGGGFRGSSEAHSFHPGKAESIGIGQGHVPVESGRALHTSAPSTTVADANSLAIPDMRELPKPGTPPALEISGQVRTGGRETMDIPKLATADGKPKLNLDASKSVADLTKSGAFVDMTDKSGTAGSPEANQQATDGKPPKVTVIMTDSTGQTPVKADFMVKADGSVAVMNNPEQTKGKEVVVAIERGAGQLMPNDAQQNSLNDLYTYLDGRIKQQFPEAAEKGVQLDDQQDLVPKQLEESLKVRSGQEKSSQLPDSAREQTDQMGRFKGSGGGKMSRGEANDYFPERTVPRGKGEDDKIAAMKDVVAGFTSRGAQKPYEHVTHRGERGFGVGRYGLTNDMIGNWLSNVDIEGLEELERQGKVPKGTAAKMKRMKASMAKAKETGNDADLDPFLQKLKVGDKNNPVTAQDINENFGKEVQELAASFNVGKFSREIGETTGKVDPGELALAMMLGRVPNEADMANDENKRFVEAARQSYQIAEGRYSQRGENIEFGDASSLTDAMKEAVGKQLWTSAAAATEYGNLGCAITVTKILRAGGVPVREVLSVDETANEMRRIGAQRVSLNEAIQSNQPYVIIKKSGGSHTGLGIGRQVVENSSGKRRTVTHDIAQSSLASGSYAFIVPTKYNNKTTTA